MDFVARVIELCSATGPAGWERILCRELGGKAYYCRSTTGVAQVRQLVALGIPRRTATSKIRGR